MPFYQLPESTKYMPTVMKRVLSEVRQSVRNLNPCKVEHFG
jgi:hypothetical protein